MVVSFLLFIYLLNKYLLSIYYVPNFIQGSEDTAVNKEAITPALMEFTFLGTPVPCSSLSSDILLNLPGLLFICFVLFSGGH